MKKAIFIFVVVILIMVFTAETVRSEIEAEEYSGPAVLYWPAAEQERSAETCPPAPKKPEPREMFEKLFPGEDYEETLDILAKVLWGECRGVKSKTNQAAVVWCIGNRVEAGKRGHNFRECATARAQFTGYGRRNPVAESLRDLAEDVLARWMSEKYGMADVGRVLPEEYLYMAGNGKYNRFRIKDGDRKSITPKSSEVYGEP